MNTEQPIIVGLDIGTTKIAVIAGRKNEFGKLEILGFGKANSNGVKHGQVLNIDETIKAIKTACHQPCIIGGHINKKFTVSLMRKHLLPGSACIICSVNNSGTNTRKICVYCKQCCSLINSKKCLCSCISCYTGCIYFSPVVTGICTYINLFIIIKHPDEVIIYCRNKTE